MSFDNLKFVWVTVFLFLIFGAALFGQKFNFKHLSTSEGLSSNEVRAVFEDSNGFMWFATSDGLNRWDGYKFEVFKNYNNDANSLSTNFLLCLAEDAGQNIWIGTNHGGLVKYSTREEKFYRYPAGADNPHSVPGAVVRCIHVDGHNSVWIGTLSGFAKYERENDRFKQFRFPGSHSPMIGRAHV